MDKYNSNKIKLDSGRVIERSEVVFRPKEKDGQFRTSDGQRYQRSKDGSIRKIKQSVKREV